VTKRPSEQRHKAFEETGEAGDPFKTLRNFGALSKISEKLNGVSIRHSVAPLADQDFFTEENTQHNKNRDNARRVGTDLYRIFPKSDPRLLSSRHCRSSPQSDAVDCQPVLSRPLSQEANQHRGWSIVDEHFLRISEITKAKHERPPHSPN
jgi:hypothetical protein